MFFLHLLYCFEAFKRGRPLIFSIFWYRFFPKIPKTPKSLKNGFYLIKSHLDQVFRVKIWPNGSIFEFGHFTRVKSWKFQKNPENQLFLIGMVSKSVKMLFWAKIFVSGPQISQILGFLELFGHFCRFWPCLEIREKKRC